MTHSSACEMNPAVGLVAFTSSTKSDTLFNQAESRSAQSALLPDCSRDFVFLFRSRSVSVPLLDESLCSASQKLEARNGAKLGTWPSTALNTANLSTEPSAFDMSPSISTQLFPSFSSLLTAPIIVSAPSCTLNPTCMVCIWRSIHACATVKGKDGLRVACFSQTSLGKEMRTRTTQRAETTLCVCETHARTLFQKRDTNMRARKTHEQLKATDSLHMCTTFPRKAKTPKIQGPCERKNTQRCRHTCQPERRRARAREGATKTSRMKFERADPRLENIEH